MQFKKSATQVKVRVESYRRDMLCAVVTCLGWGEITRQIELSSLTIFYCSVNVLQSFVFSVTSV